jgi:integrase
MTRTVRVREQLDGGDMVLCPPKSRAGKRIVGIPSAIIAALREHLDAFVEDRPDAFVFLDAGGGFLRGGNFRREASWAQGLADMGLSGLHFHDLRHTGNTLAAQSGTSLADLKARMGQDSDRVTLIYHHTSQGADRKIADALDARVRAERQDDDGTAGALVSAG